MRTIWFGDRRDLLKWGLLVHLAHEKQLKTIIQVPYLRKDDPYFWKRDGKTNRPQFEEFQPRYFARRIAFQAMSPRAPYRCLRPMPLAWSLAQSTSFVAVMHLERRRPYV
jgi:hypothetical protein